MIIYGSRASHVKTVQLQNETCPHCGTHGSLTLGTYARYAHIFWIPVFPIGRTSASSCNHCQQVLEVKQMPSHVRVYHERNLSETRVPLWQFSGLALLMVAIVFGVYGNQVDKEEQARFLESPLAGDIYEFRTKAGAYTTFKVDEVGNDTLIVKFNEYEVNKISGLYKIEIDENYSDTAYMLTKAELATMFAAGEITDINRKK